MFFLKQLQFILTITGIPSAYIFDFKKAIENKFTIAKIYLHAVGFQAASAILTASWMSTATMRETPFSCMVTPMSCSAISMVRRLCEM